MKEAKVTCVIERFPIPEMGLELTEGQHVWLTQAQYTRAPSVAKGEHIGVFKVVWKERMQTRNPAPPHFRRIVPGHNHAKGNSMPTVKPAPSAAAAETVTADVKEAVSQQLESFKEDMLGQMAALLSQQAAPKPEGDSSGVTSELLAQMKEMLETAVASAPRAAGSPAAKRQGGRQGREPVFIPKKIIGDDIEAKISVQESESEGGAVSEAAAALKALRKRKKDGI